MQRLWRLSAAVLIALALAAGNPAQAGPLEDGMVAYLVGDNATALRLWRPLADQGHAGTQFHLGHMYLKGRGVPQNDGDWVKWLRLAAEQGHANAQTELGRLFYLGHGVPENHAEAAKWYRLAPEQGDAKAQYGLSGLYYFGLGVPQNYILADMWPNLSAVNGDLDASRTATLLPGV